MLAREKRHERMWGGVGWGGDDGTILGFDYDGGYMMICIYENSWHSKLNGWT